MSTVRTLAQLRTEVLQRADIDSSTDFVDVSVGGEVDRYINESIRELFDLLVESAGQEFYITTDTVTMDGSGSVTLPSDFYLMKMVSYQESSTSNYPLEPITLRETWRTQESAAWYRGYPHRRDIRYRIQGDFSGTDGAHVQSLHYFPASSTGTLLLHYVPQPPTLDEDADTWDGFNGWEEYVIIDAALKILEKEQNPATDPLLLRKAQLTERIKFMGAQQDHGFPETVSDEYDGYGNY